MAGIEKGLMIVVRTRRETFDKEDIYLVGWIKSATYATDRPTKCKPCKTLSQIVRTSMLNIKVENALEV